MSNDFIGDALTTAQSGHQEIPFDSGIIPPEKAADYVLEDMIHSDEYNSSRDSSRPQTPMMSPMKKIGKKRGPKPGSRRAPKQSNKEEGDSELPKEVRSKLMGGLGFPDAEGSADRALISMRKRIMKYFRYFGDTKLFPYFGGKMPEVHNMGMHDLKNLEATIDFYLNDTDDNFYPKLAMLVTSNVIESVGPEIATRFGSKYPGLGVLNNVRGLTYTLNKAAEIEGDEGLKDELTLISIKYDEYKPSCPEFKLVAKIGALLNAKRQTEIDESKKSVNQSGMNL